MTRPARSCFGAAASPCRPRSGQGVAPAILTDQRYGNVTARSPNRRHPRPVFSCREARSTRRPRIGRISRRSRGRPRAEARLLGAARLTGHLAELLQQVEGLAISWLTIQERSPYADGTIADTQARSRTGVSIVAVLRGQMAFPAPTPDFGIQAGDTAVVVGTPAGVRALAGLIEG